MPAMQQKAISGIDNVLETINKQIASNLHFLRIKNGMSLSQVSSVLKISYQQVQKYETAGNRVSGPTLYVLSKLFKVEPNAFFKDLIEEDLEIRPNEVSRVLTREQAEILKLYEQLPSNAAKLHIKKTMAAFNR